MEKLKEEKIVHFVRKLLNIYDFDLVVDFNRNLEKVFRLKDLQNGNIREKDNKEFYTLADIINGLNIYHRDYIYTSLEEKKEADKNDWKMIVKNFIENENIERILRNINAQKYIYLISERNIFGLQDIIKILNEYEQFYKKVCEEYISTMSKEILLEKGQNILHIFIEDKYIELKEEGKINIENYKNYLDLGFNEYEYDSYQELFNKVIKDEIAYDLNDLELFDENRNWCFYLSFEELKKIGYGYKVKDNYPLLEKYILKDKEIVDFYDYFTLEELNELEDTLYLYYEMDDIDFDESNLELYSKSNKNFNYSVISLSEGLISFEDFLRDYKEEISNNFKLL